MAKLFNRAKVNTATVGTGTVTLGSAVSNAYCTFAEAGVANGNVVAYVIEDGNDFEIGIGTYTSAGTTLSRDTVRLSKIGGTSGTTKLTLSGSAVVFLSPAKEDLLSVSETQTANQVYAGPTSGGAATPAFRALVSADMPAAIAFSVHKNGTDQTGVAAATWTQVTFGTEVYDAGGYFASNLWTPPAGKIALSSGLYITGTWAVQTAGILGVYKDGTLFKSFNGYAGAADVFGGTLSIEDIATGSSTYGLYVWKNMTSGTGTINGGSTNTFFMGHWIGP